jgi:hypothetical protein
MMTLNMPHLWILYVGVGTLFHETWQDHHEEQPLISEDTLQSQQWS